MHNVHALDLGHRLDVGGGEYDPEPVTAPGLVAKVRAVGGWGSGWLRFEAFATIGVLALFCSRSLVCKYPGLWGRRAGAHVFFRGESRCHKASGCRSDGVKPYRFAICNNPILTYGVTNHTIFAGY